MKLYDLVDDPSKLATYGKFISPQEAYERLQQGDTTPYLVKAVASDSKWAYFYAYGIIEGRFPEGEKAIASVPYYAYRYALYTIKDRFPEGEKAIASDPEWACAYALDVIKRRFPEGEKAIVSNPKWANLYQKFLRQY